MKLRFKDENGNNYPDWEEKKLDELLEKYFSGGTPTSTNSNYYQGDINFIGSGEIGKYTTAKKINDLALKNSSAKKISKGDILYAMYGATAGKVEISPINGAINQAILCLDVKDYQSKYFILSLLKHNKTRILFKYLQGGQGNLSAGQILNLVNEYPQSLEEQEKIGSFFKLQDEVIELKEELIKEKKEYKKGLLQRVFNRELRFKDANGNEYPDWEEKKLGNLGKHTKGSGLSKSDISLNANNESILYGHLFTEYNEVIENVVYYSNKTIKTLSNENSILFPTSTTTGAFEISKFSAISKSGIQLGGDISQITFNSNVNNIFMSYSLNSKYKKEISNFAVGTTIFHLYYNDFKNIVIKIPRSLEEQEKIGNLFKTIDEEIELLENEVIQLKQKKKYYLSIMM
jgi:type I restriction enzyme S subunit